MKIEVSVKEKILAALGYIPVFCIVPYIGPESGFTKFHRKFAFALLFVEVLLLLIALIQTFKRISFILFTVCLVLSLTGMLLALAGVWIHKVRKRE